MKQLTVLLYLAMLMACLAGLTLPTAAEAEFAMEIPYGKPTVDGVIEEGEYGVAYTMDKTTAEAWVGKVGSSKVTWYLAWDEGGLYYAGTINDKTPAYRDAEHHWVGLDCLELAINPGLILSGDEAEGIFFSCGSMENGSVVVYRHNFADGLVSDEITGVNKGHTKKSSSYTMEIYLPWSLVQIDEDCTIGGKEDIHLDSTGWKAEVGAKLGLLPCAIDSLTEDGSDIIAYKFNGTDFIAKDFVVATLVNAEGELPDETLPDPELPSDGTASPDMPETPPADGTASPDMSETAPADGASPEESMAPSDPRGTEAPADGTDTSDKQGCGAAVSVGLIGLLIPVGAAILRKRED